MATLPESFVEQHIICPCCKESVPSSQTPVEDYFRTHLALEDASEDRERAYQAWLDFCGDVHKMSRWTDPLCHTHQWACKKCLRSGMALPGDATRQNYSVGGPIMSFYDHQLKCQTCSEPYLFSAQEQKFWYEELQFIVDSYPKACALCRGKKRRGVQLAKRLGELKSNDLLSPEALEEIRDIYLELGLVDKADLFSRRLKNKATKH